MKKLSQKGVLLFATATALCAFLMPSMASSASWTPIGPHHTIDSPNFGFTATTIGGPIATQCTNTTLTANVTSPANLEITNANFGAGCTLLIGVTGGTCNMTMTATRLPWTATALGTNNIQIHGVLIDLALDHTVANNCLTDIVDTAPSTITGTINGIQWNGTERAMIFNNAEGLVWHSSVLGSSALTVNGTFRDTQQSLTVD